MRSGQRRRAAVAAGMAVAGLVLAGCGGGDSESGAPAGAAVELPPSAPATAASDPAAAPTPSSTPTLPVGIRIRNQQILDEVAARIPQGKAGFARITTDLTALAMTIYWKGEPPAAVRALEGTTDSGVDVDIVQAKVSKSELDDGRKQILAAARAGKVPEPDSISVNDDFDGLVVGFVKARFDASTTTAIKEAFRSVAKVAVSFVVVAEHALD